ncbi:MAG: DUF3570 domain-containing protein [Bacteroidales bacterium]|nr:DUF3570 domain-containing protein [Bacteroidales bacterium]MCF8328687.1 DUF3570 domain-containing protein [Bacteroidales bacterium]
MKKEIIHAVVVLALLMSSLTNFLHAQNDSTTYKKKVLETTELELLMSYYEQDGDNAAVTGGIGTEELTNYTPTMVISIPLSDDDVLTVDAGLSAYTSASSSNVNPFSMSGASGSDDDDDDDDDDKNGKATNVPTGSPWVASSGASKKDILGNVSLDFAHYSDDRNSIWNVNAAFSKEYDYMSFGFGGGITRLFNERNTEINLKGQVYLDQWKRIYPTELHEYMKYGENFQNNGYFENVNVRDESGAVSASYNPFNFQPHQNKNRNSYSASLFFSQILTKRMQFAMFGDVVYQHGLLSTPFHRIYFTDKKNYYIGKPYAIPDYESRDNDVVFRLADDIERLPSSRWKFPVGMRFNYYISEVFKLRTYYRYYSDNWGLNGHTAKIEIPVSLGLSFDVMPIYRYYSQNQADYFAGFEEHVSTQKYYTSDYDLSSFYSHMIGIGFRYKDIFSKIKLWRVGFKQIDLRYNYYTRSTGLDAHIISLGAGFKLLPPQK